MADTDIDRDEQKREGETPEERLLRDIREDFIYCRDFWRDNYEEAKKDLRFVSGDPWEPDVRKEREDNNRPVVCPDELEQYLNQAINNLRQNPLAIKVEPATNDAQNKDADRRNGIIHSIEYKSNAQAAYTNAFSSAINCGFGAFRVTTKIVDKETKAQEPRLKTIENSLSVLWDPDAKEEDFSDQKICFVIDTIRKKDFAKKYPNADKKSFTADDMDVAPEWFNGENIVVAEYWRIEGYDENGDGGKVKQYITNGVEILDERDWAGSWIPIIPVLGKKVYKPLGDKMERMFYSMIRKARGPQMMLAYIASQEAEEYGMAPRSPVMGVVGQFETDKERWTNLNKVPTAFIQYDNIVDANGTTIEVPPPSRTAFTPNAQAYEIGFERWRRSVQSAMGITPLPTAAQQQNEKSGVALQRIETQQAVGAYHFTDNFKRSLENAGKQINELLTKILDTTRQVSMRQPDETHALLHVVPKGQQLPAGVNPDQVFDPQRGEFDVTISTGPSYQSQREEASAFVDLLVQQVEALPVAAPIKSKLLSLGVKLKSLGPIGDEISKLLDPQGDGEDIPPQAQAQIAQLQQAAQQAGLLIQELKQQNAALEFEKKAKVLDNQAKLDMHRLDVEADVAKAEIMTKSQQLGERVEFIHDLVMQLIGQRHETALAAANAQQQSGMAQQQAASASAQSAQDAQQSQQQQQQQQQQDPTQGE